MNKVFALLLVSLATQPVFAQSFPVSYDFNAYNKINDTLYSTNQRLHSAIRPFLVTDTVIQSAFDSSLTKKYQPASRNIFIRKFFNEHLVEYNNKDYSLYIDFFPDLQLGKDIANHQSTWLNTRAMQIGGRIGKKFSFQSSLYETQGKLPLYLAQNILQKNVAPGQGYAENNGKGVFDYASSDALFSFAASKFFTAQVGYGKNFIGDGYRSLLLSDNAFNYPFVKLITTVGPLRLVNMWTRLTDMHNNTGLSDAVSFPSKTGIFQYLDWSVNKRFTLGFFQNVMLAPQDYSMAYFNPLILLRSVNFAEGSPGKLLIGFNGSYKLSNKWVAYGQLVINEFEAKKIFTDPGYAQNKQGYQLGIKGINFLGVKHLNILGEYNSIRPFVYAANSSLINYGHYQQSLADPLGSNFREAIGIVNYSFNRFDCRAQFNYAFHGVDDPTQPGVSFGQDIYKPYTLRSRSEGYFIGNGIPTTLRYLDLKLAYQLNYKNNLRVELGYVNRNESNSLGTSKTSYLSIGLKGSFRNLYYDF